MFRKLFSRNESQIGSERPWGAPILMAMAAFGFMAWPGASEFFQFDRLSHGQFFRWVTCHFTHWTWDHFFWDAVVFAVLGAWVAGISRLRFWVTLGISIPFISLAVWGLIPEMRFYRGLSGLDSALFGCLAAALAGEALKEKNKKQLMIVILFLCGFIGKTGFEILSGSSFFVHSGELMTPVPLAHAAGITAGLFSGKITSIVRGGLVRGRAVCFP